MLTVIDRSPNDEGYAQPLIEGEILLAVDDSGMGRWLRTDNLYTQLETHPVIPPAMTERLRNVIKQSEEVPPSIDW